MAIFSGLEVSLLYLLLVDGVDGCKNCSQTTEYSPLHTTVYVSLLFDTEHSRPIETKCIM